MRQLSIALTILILLALTGLGLVYTFTTTMLPYHAAALGVDPATLSPNNTALYFAILRACGMNALMTAALATFVFVNRDRIGGELATGFLLIVAIMGGGGQALNAYELHRITGANTPWMAIAGIGVLAGLAGALWFAGAHKR